MSSQSSNSARRVGPAWPVKVTSYVRNRVLAPYSVFGFLLTRMAHVSLRDCYRAPKRSPRLSSSGPRVCRPSANRVAVRAWAVSETTSW